MTRQATSRRTRTTAVLVSFTLLASACTGDDDADDLGTSGNSTEEAVTDSSDEEAVVDPFDEAGWAPAVPTMDVAPALHIEDVPVVDRVPPPELDPTESPPFLEVP